MAIAEMSQMTLLAKANDKDALLDAMRTSGAVQVKSCEPYEWVTPLPEENDSEVESRIQAVQKALAYLSKTVQNAPHALREDGLIKDGFGVTIAEFEHIGETADDVMNKVAWLAKAQNSQEELENRRATLRTEMRGYLPYADMVRPFATYSDTQKTRAYVGLIDTSKWRVLKQRLATVPLCCWDVLSEKKTEIVFACVSYYQQADEMLATLADGGATRCPYTDERTAAEAIAGYRAEINRVDMQLAELQAEVCAVKDWARDLKLYEDYLGFVQEKERTTGMLAATQSTVMVQAWVPTESRSAVETELRTVTDALAMEWKTIPRDEYAPTLMKNNRQVENFEVVTNMYSVPKYGALDPNGVMSFFFTLFMGVIMADVGYGILMLIGGFWLASTRRRGTSLFRMAKTFGYGGIAAIAIGALMDSWFGFDLLRQTAGEAYNAFYAAYIDPIGASATIMGISVPSVLLWCLALGVVQIAASLVMKAIQHFGRGEILDGIFGGLVWAVGWLAFAVWVFAMAKGYAWQSIAMYVTAGCMGVGILTAGITAKKFGKVTKIFGALYGLINYMSDILSYARLYGLMLSGAQVATIFTKTLAIGMLFPKGPVGIIFGVLLIVVGNVFNVAISLLGAFIHDSRLQYVEFFGRFYEGDGDLFRPLGSDNKHVYLKINEK